MQEAAQITSTAPHQPFVPPYSFSLLWGISKSLTTTTKWRFFFWPIKTASQTWEQDGLR